MGYFQEVLATFGTEFWVNNPSGPELQRALAMGAVGVASNPAYGAALLKSEPEFICATIEALVRESSSTNVELKDELLAMRVLQNVVSRATPLFHPLFKRSEGHFGYVAIQGNPRRNGDLSTILQEAETFRRLGENIIIKVPATIVGAQAMEELTARGWPTIGTMCFAVDQYIYLAEAHRRGLRRTKTSPRCLITMLPGIFDEYLAENAARRGVTILPETLRCAGIATAKATYAVRRQRGYEAIILCGGARSTSHWTELVGRDMAITLSGSLAERLLSEHPPAVSRIEESAAVEAIAELRQKFPDFVRACDEGMLRPEEFCVYGPVVRFQNTFLSAFGALVGEIQSLRNSARSACAC